MNTIHLIQNAPFIGGPVQNFISKQFGRGHLAFMPFLFMCGRPFLNDYRHENHKFAPSLPPSNSKKVHLACVMANAFGITVVEVLRKATAAMGPAICALSNHHECPISHVNISTSKIAASLKYASTSCIW